MAAHFGAPATARARQSKVFLYERLAPLGACILVIVSMAGIASSWTALSATNDEPFHIACGMEWLDRGAYTYELQHPPIARAVAALGPYLEGLRSLSLPTAKQEGVAILTSAGDYRRNLEWARSGNLIFFALAVWTVWLWAKRWFGPIAAFWAVLLFVHVPPILGHAGLATLDMACAATVGLALYVFMLAVESPSHRNLLLASVTFALAVLCKFSSLAFLGASFLTGLIYVMVRRQSDVSRRPSWPAMFMRGALTCVAAMLVIWAGYRFSREAIVPGTGPDPAIERVFARSPVVKRAAYAVTRERMPLAPLLRGIHEVKTHDSAGHDAYLLGKYRHDGWWYFFPVVLAVKTPIPFLLAVGWGALLIVRRFRATSWAAHLTVLFPLMILAVCMDSRINLGVRHILPIYVPLSVLGGYGLAELFRHAKGRRAWFYALPVAIIAWLAAECWTTRPDYLAYFSEAARRHPEKVLAESDLDWGQDLYRLSRRLKERGVTHVAIRYFGPGGLLDSAGLPPYSIASAIFPVQEGYVAISVRYLTLERAKNGSYSWLDGVRPLEIVGRSIYLYKMGGQP